MDTPLIDNRAAELRAEFDQSFARAPGDDAAAMQSLLAIRLGGAPYALHVSDVTSVLVDRRITALPTPVPHLRGLVGIRGAIVPVYDLAALLGHPDSSTPRWLVTASAAPIAFAVEQFEGLATVRADHVLRAEAGALLAGSIVVEGQLRSLIALRPLIDAIAATGHQSHIKGDLE